MNATIFFSCCNASMSDDLIKINISTSLSNTRSALQVVKTILHEYIHADMNWKLYSRYALVTNQEINFLETYNSFEETNFEPTSQHQTMAELYINAMAEALGSFHKNQMKEDFEKYENFYGEKPSSDFYKALAWEGLSIHKSKSMAKFIYRR